MLSAELRYQQRQQRLCCITFPGRSKAGSSQCPLQEGDREGTCKVPFQRQTCGSSTRVWQVKPARELINFDWVSYSSKTLHQILSSCKIQTLPVLRAGWLWWWICSYQQLINSQLEDFLLPGHLELGGDWVLTMSTSPPTWSDNILEGIATKKSQRTEEAIKRCITWGASQAPGAHSSGVPKPSRTILVSDAPNKWPEWEWLMHNSIPISLRLGEGSACWGLLKLVMKIT